MAQIPEPHRIKVPDSSPPATTRDPVTGRWLPGCPSPNPKGRPKGRWSDKLHALVPKALAAIEAALDDGDMSAVAHLLSRTVPALKAESPEVEFEFDPNASPAKMSAQVLSAVSKGQLSPEMAKTMQEIIASHINLRDIESLLVEFRKMKEPRRSQAISGGVITT